MAKSRIAPINKLSTPQMELNAAELSKRGGKVIERDAVPLRESPPRCRL